MSINARQVKVNSLSWILYIPIRRVFPLEDSNGRMTRWVKWWQALYELSLYGTKEKYRITRWYDDQAWIDQRNLNVEINDQINQEIIILASYENCVARLNIIKIYSNWRFDGRFDLKKYQRWLII